MFKPHIFATTLHNVYTAYEGVNNSTLPDKGECFYISLLSVKMFIV